MNYLPSLLDALASHQAWGYHPKYAPAAEPTALAALALAASQRPDAAQRARTWLAEIQNPDGSVGIRRGEPSPGWPTALAILAWTQQQAEAPSEHGPTTGHPVSRFDAVADFADARRRALDWMLTVTGETGEMTGDIGHDTRIAGWPWAVGTHSWVEPTAMSLLALRASGNADHSRARDAARLLVDRLLPTGGCNYGNTFVLGQALLPHVQPTGLAMIALAGYSDPQIRIERSLVYLEQTLGPNTAAASLAYALLGLAAQGRVLPQADTWLDAAAARSLRLESSYEVALLALAAGKADSPFVMLTSMRPCELAGAQNDI